MIEIIRKNNRIFIMFAIITAIIITIMLLCESGLLSLHWLNNAPLDVSQQTGSLVSPNGDYTLKSYKYSGGATVDWTSIVCIIENKTTKSKCIYTKYHEQDVDMKWNDNETVEINSIVLNIYNEFYDSKKFRYIWDIPFK